ncbi:MAG: hypothetical protein KDA05_10670, partial [Phycisphaerales bacterium]|nr:hypothetical protein [Phycisphaerales bacterium]
ADLLVEFEGAALPHRAPRVTHVPTGEVLVDYWGTGWFGVAAQDQRGRLRLWVRRERGDLLGHSVVIDPIRGTITRDYGKGRIAIQRPACLNDGGLAEFDPAISVWSGAAA